MKKITMTLLEVYYAMREVGIRTSPKRIGAGIKSGAYPFGRVVSEGPTGKCEYEIFRVEFDAWLETKMPKEEKQNVPNP